ncbi:cytosolic sulfotransferase 5-like [Triticum aestivum]|uniref:cytosolic sulfotransferase 5-like n=1 Tax=Triticum aestivum TaxID=4565 RepID=UPI001D02A5EE|nr:cytosolic sulfotransferase 5-like [Triticum aestivum]
MAAPVDTSFCLVGPVPFKDVHQDDDDHAMPQAEDADVHEDDEDDHVIIISPGLPLRLHQGVWLFDDLRPASISVQRRFVLRPGDVLLASPPKCGTTWLKALAFATMARAAYPVSDANHPLRRLNPHECVPFMEALFSEGQQAKLEALPSPRLLQTHMHHSMLPHSLAGTPDCKLVFICREPKDMLVSSWHLYRSTRGVTLSFSDMFELACEGKIAYGPLWDQLLGYWNASKAAPERVMFLRYEQMMADPVSTDRELARFLGVPFTPAEEAAGVPADIAEMCSIGAMRGLDANRRGSTGTMSIQFRHETFFRKGVVGDWVNHMTPEMARRIDAILEEKLRALPESHPTPTRHAYAVGTCLCRRPPSV